MGFFGAAHGWEGGGLFPPVLKICHTYPTMMKLGSYTLPKEDPKSIWLTCHIPWVLLTSAFFHQKTENFGTSTNTDIDWILINNFDTFNFSWLFSNCFNKHGYNFHDVSKNGFFRPS